MQLDCRLDSRGSYSHRESDPFGEVVSIVDTDRPHYLIQIKFESPEISDLNYEAIQYVSH